jgi:drug/metabolite transporter (DMT)-like permease
MLSALCFGAAVLPSQWATSAGLSVAAVVSVRFLAASLLVAPLAVRSAGPADRTAQPPLGRYLLAWTVSGGANTGGFLLLTAALDRTSAATAAFLSSLSVLVVPVVVAVVGRRLPPPARLAGVALAVLGSFVLAGGRLSLEAGALLALGAAFLGAAHVLSVGWFAPRLSVPRYNLGQLVVVALAAGVVVPLSGGPGSVTVIGLAAAAWCGVAQAAGLSLQARAQQDVDGSTAALVFTLVPVVALLSAWSLDGQTPALTEVAGGALLIAAVAVGEGRWARRRPPLVPVPPGPRAAEPVAGAGERA